MDLPPRGRREHSVSDVFAFLVAEHFYVIEHVVTSFIA